MILIAGFLVALFLSTTFSFTWAMGVLKPRFSLVSAWAERYKEWQEERAREEVRRRSEERKAPKKQVVFTAKEPPQTALDFDSLSARSRKPAPQPAPIPGRTAAASRAPLPPPADFPPTSLLHAPVASAQVDEEELRQRALLIEKKTREFEVE